LPKALKVFITANIYIEQEKDQLFPASISLMSLAIDKF